MCLLLLSCPFSWCPHPETIAGPSEASPTVSSERVKVSGLVFRSVLVRFVCEVRGEATTSFFRTWWFRFLNSVCGKDCFSSLWGLGTSVKTHSKSTGLRFWALGSGPSVRTSVFTTGPHRVPVLQQLESQRVSPSLLFLRFKILRRHLGFLEVPYIGPIFFFF